MTGIPSRKLSGLHELLNGSVELKKERCMLHSCPGKTLAGRKWCWVPVLAPNPFAHVLAHGDFSCTVILSKNWKRDFPSLVNELGVFTSQSSQKPIRQGVLLGGGKQK